MIFDTLNAVKARLCILNHQRNESASQLPIVTLWFVLSLDCSCKKVDAHIVIKKDLSCLNNLAK